MRRSSENVRTKFKPKVCKNFGTKYLQEQTSIILKYWLVIINSKFFNANLPAMSIYKKFKII